MNGIKIVALSVVFVVATEGIAIWQNLLLLTNATKHQLIGGGIVGFLLGLILGATTPLRLKWAVAAGVLGIVAIAAFDKIVYGELALPDRVYVLYLLGFFIAGSLAFLGTKVSQRVVLGKQAES